MKHLAPWLLVVTAFLPLGARGALLPDGTSVRWTVSTSEYDVTLVMSNPYGGGEMTVTRRASGAQFTALLGPVYVSNGAHGATDNFNVDALLFPAQESELWDFVGKAPPPPSSGIHPNISIALVDQDGVAFDDVTDGRPPADPPPLALFETATLSLPSYFCTTLCYTSSIDQQITGLPEPGLMALAVTSLGLLGLRKRRAPEA